MNSELNREGVIINPNNLIEREPPKLGLGPRLRKPTLIDALLQKIENPLHGGLPLLLHRLVIVRGDEHLGSALLRVEETALRHETEEPVAVSNVVTVEQEAHVGGVEGGGFDKVRGRVVEAVVRGERSE